MLTRPHKNFILLFLLHVIAMNSLAQLKPVVSGVIHWADAPVKKDSLWETRRLAEGTTPEFEYFENMLPRRKKELCQNQLICKKIRKK